MNTPYLVSRRSECMEPVYANAVDAAHVTLDEDELDHALCKVGFAINVTGLPQHMLQPTSRAHHPRRPARPAHGPRHSAAGCYAA